MSPLPEELPPQEMAEHRLALELLRKAPQPVALDASQLSRIEGRISLRLRAPSPTARWLRRAR